MSQSILTTRIMEALGAGRKALIPFLPGGFPDKERFFDELAALDAGGADVIEIGVPFSDPVADGPVVEKASLACLLDGTCLAWLLGELTRRKGRYRAGLVLMGYYNPFLQYGLDALARDAAAAGVAGCIVPDLPLEESGPMAEALGKRGLDLIPLIGLNTPEERLAAYAKTARGYVYFVSVLGTTGMRESLPAEITERLKVVRRLFDVPVALGFGIKSPGQLTAFGDLIDGVVFGSALIAHIDAGGTAAEFMERWRS
ncbi:tryptophan synthase, alpha subunit [Solidesulfovibrio carbinoliphilus subsp. oakridgensis]|uniref:Tryptophan synthase alpha chain n=1 Tax=Solidesulfovibrio carbinoliphilus subsp. oakridgensis TaxID=694327 RepID=G7QAV3_9BACT|nr:tryptophan synthase subunit alpha [Solidesulfovibrio carbinoliphilus]EHJ48294.1 tryptophan synthase, alpha subunit [Solidesulfovibrio carbinoliphilus subsp. oakridgensis]